MKALFLLPGKGDVRASIGVLAMRLTGIGDFTLFVVSYGQCVERSRLRCTIDEDRTVGGELGEDDIFEFDPLMDSGRIRLERNGELLNLRWTATSLSEPGVRGIDCSDPLPAGRALELRRDAEPRGEVFGVKIRTAAPEPRLSWLSTTAYSC